MKYLDFDLSIEPSGEGFTAKVFNSPGGQASTEFTAPFSDLEVENFLLRIGRSRHAVRRIESPEMTNAKLFGGRLFSSVFAGDVRGCLRSSLDEANRQGMGLRLRLHLGNAPALADLPWEFLYNGSMNRFLGLSVETPVVRYMELPERIRPVLVKPPLKVLMMISSPSDYPQLDVKREADKMNEALAELEEAGLIAVERQEVATLAELQRRLRKSEYHIFHFIGHGGFDDNAQDGLLILEEPDERGRRVSAQFLGTLLHDHRSLRLAVLNACEGARASRADPFSGTAQSLVQQGIPAVIAMQFEVTDEAAICFTREFYAAIAVGYPVDAALAEARKAIFAEVSEIEWGTPVLYMRSPDGLIFEVEKVSEEDLKKLKTTSESRARRSEEQRQEELRKEELHKQELQQQELRQQELRQQELRQQELRQQELRQQELRQQELALEAQKNSARKDKPTGRARSFVMGGVLGAVAGVGLLVVGIVVIAAIYNSRNNSSLPVSTSDIGGGLVTPPAPSPNPVTPSDPGENSRTKVAPLVTPPDPVESVDPNEMVQASADVQAELQRVVYTADQAEILAFSTLNATVLQNSYTGDIYNSYILVINQLRQEGVVMVNTLHNFTFHGASVSRNGQQAEVRVTERWSSNFVNAQGRCVSHYHEHDVPQTAMLRRAGNGWLIYNVKQPSEQLVMAACH